VLLVLLFSCPAIAGFPGWMERVNLRYSSDKSEVVAKTSGFSESDFEIVNGKVFLKRPIAETIVKKLLKTDDDIKFVVFPWFEGAVSSDQVAVARQLVKTHLLSEEMLLLYIVSPESGEFLEYADEFGGNFDEGKFSISYFATPDVLPPSPLVGFADLTVFIRDGGRFDLDKTENSLIISQLAIVKKTKPAEKPIIIDPGYSSGSDSNNGSGCNVSYGSILSLLVGIACSYVILRKRKEE